MALYDDPPHTISLLSSTSGRDTAGGTTVAYSPVQTGIKCSINTVSANEQEMFAQIQIQVSHSIAILTSALTVTVVRGMQATDEDGLSYQINGIRSGRSYGAIPAFTYLQVQQML